MPSISSLAVILPAAGSSTRFGGGRHKVLEQLGGRRVIERSIEAFRSRSEVKQIVIAASQEVSAVLSGLAGLTICAGGSNRAESVRNALKMVDEKIEWV